MNSSSFSDLLWSYLWGLQQNLSLWIDIYFSEGPYPFWQLPLGCLQIVLLGSFLYGIFFSILYFGLKKWIHFPRKKYFFIGSILLRFVPFGYIMTSFLTLGSIKDYEKGLLKEIIYTFITGIVYFGVIVLLR